MIGLLLFSFSFLLLLTTQWIGILIISMLVISFGEMLGFPFTNSFAIGRAPKGKEGKFPVKLLAGYELSTADGTIAIIDSIDQNIWFYNELNDADKLMVAAITTAIFARRVNDTKW